MLLTCIIPSTSFHLIRLLFIVCSIRFIRVFSRILFYVPVTAKNRPWFLRRSSFLRLKQFGFSEFRLPDAWLSTPGSSWPTYLSISTRFFLWTWIFGHLSRCPVDVRLGLRENHLEVFLYFDRHFPVRIIFRVPAFRWERPQTLCKHRSFHCRYNIIASPRMYPWCFRVDSKY